MQLYQFSIAKQNLCKQARHTVTGNNALQAKNENFSF